MIDPFFGGLLTGGLSLFGDLIGGSSQNKMNQQMQRQAQAFNADQSQQQMNFQREMSNSAYQRSRADMEAAGLNPMMMFGSGTGASTPGGAMATTQPAQQESPMKNLGKNVEKVLSSAIQAKTLEKMSDEIANLKATRGYIEAETKSEHERPSQIRAATHLTNTHSAKEGHLMPVYRAAGKQGSIHEEFYNSGAGRFLELGSLGGKKLDDVVSPVGNILNSAKRGVDIKRGTFNERFPDRDVTYLDEFGNQRTSQTTFKKRRK